MAQKTRVLIIDDAKFMIKAIRDILISDPAVEVVDSARNGLDGLAKIKRYQPDVITLDMDMPIMDGIRTIRHIMIESPVPIVVLSSLFRDGAITFEALRLGAVDFMPKPSGAISYDIHRYQQQIIDRIKIATAVNLHNIRRVHLPHWNANDNIVERYAYHGLDYLIAIGTTLGGPNTCIRLFANLSPTLPAAAIVVQEISPKVVPAFVKKFDEHVAWKIEEAKNGTVIQQGSCYICSNEVSLSLDINEQGETIIIILKAVERPLDQLFISVATIYKQQTIGLLLTGIGDDGTQGFKKIRSVSGMTIAQTTDTCVYPNLTQSVIEQHTVDIVADESVLVDKITAMIN